MQSSRLNIVTAPPLSALIIMMSFLCFSCSSACRSFTDKLYVFCNLVADETWSLWF